MNIFLNELYRLEDSQEGLRALVEKRKTKLEKSLNRLAKFSNTH